MTDTQRAFLYSLYITVCGASTVLRDAPDVHRALCQLRASIERTLGMERTPTRSERAHEKVTP